MVGLMASFDVAQNHNQQKHLILQSKLRAIYLMENNFDISNYNENSKFTPTPPPLQHSTTVWDQTLSSLRANGALRCDPLHRYDQEQNR